MISNTVKGARAARQTIFSPTEEPPWDDGALEPAHEGLAEPDEVAEAGAPDAAPPPASQGESVDAPVSPAAHVTRYATRYAWIREVTQAGDGAIFRAEEAETRNLVTVELLSQTAARDAEQV